MERMVDRHGAAANTQEAALNKAQAAQAVVARGLLRWAGEACINLTGSSTRCGSNRYVGDRRYLYPWLVIG